MAKELFNQPTVSTIGDDDRFAFGEPGQTGGHNVLWSEFKTILKALLGHDLGFALSDETSDLTTDNDAEIEIIRAQTIESITLYVNTAPTGSSVICEIYKDTTLIETITLPASNTTVTVANTTSLDVGDRLKANITQVGSTVAGTGAKIGVKTKLS